MKNTMIDIIFFPGKNAPVKRYRAFFPTLNLGTQGRIILCHSLGVISAIKYMEENKVNLPVICMDTVALPETAPNVALLTEDVSKKYSFFLFRREISSIKEDESKYKKVFYVKTENHYIHECKNVRDKIIKLIDEL